MYFDLFSSENVGKLNEDWELAYDYFIANDLDNFKKLIDENKDLLNWQHEEHHTYIWYGYKEYVTYSLNLFSNLMYNIILLLHL